MGVAFSCTNPSADFAAAAGVSGRAAAIASNPMKSIWDLIARSPGLGQSSEIYGNLPGEIAGCNGEVSCDLEAERGGAR
jgi:hypothetical protein